MVIFDHIKHQSTSDISMGQFSVNDPSKNGAHLMTVGKSSAA